jgi:quinol monooxygenase YgiN
MSRLEVNARMAIRDGRLEGFKQQAAEIIRLARERDTKTLRYDWFLSSDRTECEVHEVYESSAGLIEHRMHCRRSAGSALQRGRRRSRRQDLQRPVAAARRAGECDDGC